MDLKSKLADYLRQGSDTLTNLPTEAQRFLTNPQAFTQLITGNNPLPRETGFAAGATGLPANNPVQGGVLNPASAPYQQGYEQGEPIAIASMALPAALMAAKSLRMVKPITPKLDDIGLRFQNRLDSDYDNLAKEYALLKDAEGGKVLNTDLARELSPDYFANRTLSANVHEPASAFVKQLYAQKLAQQAPEGTSVLFTGGGTGAGKTSSLKAYPDLRKNAEMIYDTNMNKLESATKKIDQALEAGRKVDLVYTYRDPVEALVEGSLKRAMRMKEELGSGRTVPLKEHIRTHTGSRKVIGELQDIYGDNPNVRIGIIDNRYGQANPKSVNLKDLPEIDAKKLEKDLRNALETQYKSGKIDKDIYESSK
jgi:hypothetical protein